MRTLQSRVPFSSPATVCTTHPPAALMLATPADAAVATVLFSHPRRLLFACARSAGGNQSTTAFLCTSLRTDVPIRYATLVEVAG